MTIQGRVPITMMILLALSISTISLAEGEAKGPVVSCNSSWPGLSIDYFVQNESKLSKVYDLSEKGKKQLEQIAQNNSYYLAIAASETDYDRKVEEHEFAFRNGKEDPDFSKSLNREALNNVKQNFYARTILWNVINDMSFCGQLAGDRDSFLKILEEEVSLSKDRYIVRSGENFKRNPEIIDSYLIKLNQDLKDEPYTKVYLYKIILAATSMKGYISVEELNYLDIFTMELGISSHDFNQTEFMKIMRRSLTTTRNEIVERGVRNKTHALTQTDLEQIFYPFRTSSLP